MKIGVFVCHCGTNISATVDVEEVARAASILPGVNFAATYKYMCSSPGQTLVQDMIRKNALDRIVISACSPSLHEKTFRKCAEDAGINPHTNCNATSIKNTIGVGVNPYLVEIANIREHCSWVHQDKKEATRKAVDLVRLAVAKVSRNRPLVKTYVPIEKRVLVIGAGIAGIQAAIDISFAKFPVVMVERGPSIGGRMAQFDKTFPTLDCAACILTPKMVAVAQNKYVTIHTHSEIEEVTGHVGDFKVRIRKKARSVDLDKCTGCGACFAKCPVKVDSEFDMKLGKRKAIYVPFPQAVPNVPVIDREHCLWFTKSTCGVCRKVCPFGAINYDMQDEVIEEKFGAIIVATGFTQFDHSVYGEYGYGKYKDMITGLHFERMANSSGPTGGKIVRPSDGKEAKDVVFIQCVGSRDEQKGVPYCSRVCCMYTAKHALLLKEHNKDAQAYVFYIDIRAAGKNYEEFVKKVQDEYGAVYLRGRVSRVFEKDGKLIVRGADTLSGSQIEIKADMVVLANGLVAQDDATKLAQMLHIPYDKNRLFTEAHPKLAPAETITSGIFLTGACQSPKDIPDTVATASAASVKALGLMVQDKLEREPLIAKVDVKLCSGCKACVAACPFSAIEMKEVEDRTLKRKRSVAEVIDSVCTGCGNCTAACRMSAIDLEGFTNRQIMEEIEAL